MSDNIIKIFQSDTKNKIVTFFIDTQKKEFDSGIEFSDAFVFPNRKIVLVLHSFLSKNYDYVGAIFDLSGNKMMDVSFPGSDYRRAHVNCMYSWATEIDSGIKMIFGTDSVMYGDFWVDFDLNTMKYGNSGKSR